MKLKTWLYAAAVLAAFPAVVGNSAAALAQSGEQRQELDRIVARGRLLFGLDRAAWIGTDDFLERVPNAAAVGVRGYIVEEDPNGFTVIFYAGQGEELVAAYKGQVRSGGIASREIFSEGQRPALTAMQKRMVRAVEVARRTSRRPCGTSPFNPLVIPPTSVEEPIEVYLMTPQTNDLLPVGGHYKVTVSPQGKVTDTRAFSKSCLAMPAKPEGAQMLVVSHLLDRLPTETHVFTSMAAGVPMVVATSEGRQMWQVSGDGISLFEVPQAKRR